MSASAEQVLKTILTELCSSEGPGPKFSKQETEHAISFEVTVPSEDLGQVLGKNGTRANALRTIFSALFGKEGKKQFNLLIVNPTKQKTDLVRGQ